MAAKMGRGGVAWYLLSSVFALAILVVVVIIHGMSWTHVAVKLGLLHHTQTQNWLVQELAIVGIQWLIPIWAVIYMLQFSWLFYTLSLGCQHYKTGALIMNPPIIPTSMFLTFALGVAGTLGWLVLWDNHDYCVYSAICILGATIFLSLSMAVSLHATKLYQDEVITKGYISDVWTIRSLVQNALAAYVAWTFVLTAYTIAMILKRFELLGPDEAQYVGLSIMMGHIIIWMILDVVNAKALTHFVVLPYVVYIVVFIQPVLNHSFDSRSPFFSMGLVYLLVTTLLALIKVTAAVWRCRKSAKALLAEEEFGATEYKDDFEDLGQVTLVHTLFPNPRSRVYDDVSISSSNDSIASTTSNATNPNNAEFDDNSSQVAFITLASQNSNTSDSA